MSQSQLFLRFKETIKIEKAINNTYVETNNYNEKYNEKIKTYLSQKAQQFLQYHNKYLEYNESQIYTLQFLPRYIFLVLSSKYWSKIYVRPGLKLLIRSYVYLY